MANDKTDDDLLAQMEALEAREKEVQQESQRVEKLASQVEVLAAKLEAKATNQPATELKLTATAGKGVKTFRVIAKNENAAFRSALVENCCDESEAVRVVLQRFGYRETHTIKCAVEAV